MVLQQARAACLHLHTCCCAFQLCQRVQMADPLLPRCLLCSTLPCVRCSLAACGMSRCCTATPPWPCGWARGPLQLACLAPLLLRHVATAAQQTQQVQQHQQQQARHRSEASNRGCSSWCCHSSSSSSGCAPEHRFSKSTTFLMRMFRCSWSCRGT
jgi:hypothetical protein